MAAKRKRSDPPAPKLLARIKNLRRLSHVVASGDIGERAQLEIILALDNFADYLRGPSKGTPPRRLAREQWFLQLTGLFWHAQKPPMREAKSMAWARREVARLTSWTLPRVNPAYRRREDGYYSRLDLKTAEELAEHKANAVTVVPADRREAVAFAIGLRKK